MPRYSIIEIKDMYYVFSDGEILFKSHSAEACKKKLKLWNISTYLKNQWTHIKCQFGNNKNHCCHHKENKAIHDQSTHTEPANTVLLSFFLKCNFCNISFIF